MSVRMLLQTGEGEKRGSRARGKTTHRRRTQRARKTKGGRKEDDEDETARDALLLAPCTSGASERESMGGAGKEVVRSRQTNAGSQRKRGGEKHSGGGKCEANEASGGGQSTAGRKGG